MPSLMAFKKALPGRQPGSFRESFISVECFLIVKKRGEPKNFSKRKVKVRETSIVEVGELLELCSCSRNFVNLDYIKFSTKIIIPLYNSIVL